MTGPYPSLVTAEEFPFSAVCQSYLHPAPVVMTGPYPSLVTAEEYPFPATSHTSLMCTDLPNSVRNCPCLPHNNDSGTPYRSTLPSTRDKDIKAWASRYGVTS